MTISSRCYSVISYGNHIILTFNKIYLYDLFQVMAYIMSKRLVKAECKVTFKSSFTVFVFNLVFATALGLRRLF